MNEWERLHQQAKRYQAEYPPGTRIMLLSMGRDPNPVEDQTRGTVRVVDDIGTLHCSFDNGRSLGVVPGEDSFRKLTEEELAFGVHQPIDDLTFSVLCAAMEHDDRITALLEFDFDDGTISVKEQGDSEWRTYRLKDVSTAVYRAERKSTIPIAARELIFEEALRDREIDWQSPEQAEETTPPVQEM